MGIKVTKQMVEAVNQAILDYQGQVELANAIGISKSSISRLVNGDLEELRPKSYAAYLPVFEKYIPAESVTEKDLGKIPIDETLMLETYRELDEQQRREAHALLRQLLKEQEKEK